MNADASMQVAMLLGPEHIEVRRVPRPVPDTGEVLLRIGAATTCGTDVKVFRRGGHPRMLVAPTAFGHEMAGTIAECGASVTRFTPGDRVVVSNSAPCGDCAACRRGRENLCSDLHYLNGAFAEYIIVPERFVARSLYPLPPDMSFQRAALTEPLACVVHGMEACAPFLSQRADVLVLGGGPIGLLFVATLAREGHRVLLADPNPSRLQVGRRMGATHLLQACREGGQEGEIRALFPDGADVAIDCTGTPLGWQVVLDAVKIGGMVNLFGGCAPGTSVALDTHRIHYSEITVKGVYHHRPSTFARALDYLDQDDFPADHLLGATRPISEVEQALRSMIDKQNLKVVISNR
ncbi:MAG: alcohol dehydrogenase catalytic domain-containing protein [Gammaproteobacteria bacterium]|nr:alcohol dehydrogenase catalytic domain-containing protein [Gammaproteobacteria bacterium]